MTRTLGEIRRRKAYRHRKPHRSARKRAREILKIKKMTGRYYIVFGGKNEHVVYEENDDYYCDCDAFLMNQLRLYCSHIWKYRMEIEGWNPIIKDLP